MSEQFEIFETGIPRLAEQALEPLELPVQLPASHPSNAREILNRFGDAFG
jgi:hypothetical protein